MEQASAGNVREDQDAKADQLGNSGGGGCSCHTHIQSKDKDRIQDDIQNSAEAHSNHG